MGTWFQEDCRGVRTCQLAIANDRRKWRWRDGDYSAQTIDEVIAERGGDVGDMSEINVGDVSEIKLSDRQQIIVSIIRSNPTVSAKQMSETLSVTSRTIERDLAVMQKRVS